MKKSTIVYCIIIVVLTILFSSIINRNLVITDSRLVKSFETLIITISIIVMGTFLGIVIIWLKDDIIRILNQFKNSRLIRCIHSNKKIRIATNRIIMITLLLTPIAIILSTFFENSTVFHTIFIFILFIASIICLLRGIFYKEDSNLSFITSFLSALTAILNLLM
ncbi:MAG: hypothetical protein N2749_02940 [Clostridia bacterium]|nr:hypothetical protein [Clostridia bacterium]